MAKKDNEINIIETKGVNEIEIVKHKLYVVKNGNSKILKVKTNNSQKPSWVWIPTEYLENAKQLGNSTIVSYDKWGNWKDKNKKPIHEYGIEKQYALGNAIEITTSKKYVLNGTIFYVEAFFNQPKFEQGFYIATVEEQKLLSAYFASYKDEYLYPGEDKKSNIHTYKSTMRLYITTHLIPDYTAISHNFALFEIDIFDADGDKKVTDEPLRYYQRTHDGKFSVNTLTEIEFEIDEKWRDTSNHKKDTIKTFYAKIKTIIKSNEDAYTGEKGQKGIDDKKWLSSKPKNRNLYTNKFSSVAPNGEIIGVELKPEDDIKPSYLSWYNYYDTDAKKDHASLYSNKELEPYSTIDPQVVVLKNQEVSFQVRYNLMDVILDNYEVKKNNMMVVIGDVAYSKKGIEPCKYSSIEVKIKDKKPIEIFNEDEKVSKKLLDRTSIPIGIIAGDKKENVTITAKGLATEFYNNKNVNCLGITSKIKINKKGVAFAKKVKHKKDKDFKHSDIEEVFNMQKSYALFPDRENNINAPATKTKGDEKVDIINQNIKYKHGTDSIELELGYLYNKNYNDRVLNFLAHKTKSLKGIDNLKNIWLINYLIKFIKNEKLDQSYFVPVTTCRYPNQMVQLAVYPDMKWVLNFNYNIKTPLYYKATTPLESYYADFNEGKHTTTSNSNKRKDILDKSINNELQHFVGRKTDFGLYVECELDGSQKIKFGKDFAEKFRSMLAPLVWIVNKLDSDIGVSKAKAEQKKLKRVAKPGLLARLNKLPMSFELMAPNIGVGVGIGYGETKDYQVGYELEGRLLMDPVIGANIKLDILALGSKFKPWGAIIDVLDIASWLVNFCSDGKVEIDYKIDIIFSAEIKLIGNNTKGKSDIPATVSYNFMSRKFESNIAFQGVIKGEIEMSLSVIIKSKKKVKVDVDEDKFNELGNLEIGAKAYSYVKLTAPTELNKSGDYEFDYYFSGIVLELWFKAKLSTKSTSKPKELAKKLIPHADLKKTIKFGETK